MNSFVLYLPHLRLPSKFKIYSSVHKIITTADYIRVQLHLSIRTNPSFLHPCWRVGGSVPNFIEQIINNCVGSDHE